MPRPLAFPRPFVAAHRGSASKRAPDNTLAAFEAAIAGGADAVELDVWRTSDARLVVVHDLGDDRRPIAGLTLAEVREALPDRAVPTFEEVAAGLSGRVLLDVELKDAAGAAGVVDALIAHGWIREEFVVTSFDPEALRSVHAHDQAVYVGLLVDRSDRPDRMSLALATAAAVGADFVAPHESLLDEDALSRCAAAGLPVVAWVVDDERRLRALYGRPGIEGVITGDVPAALGARPTGATVDEVLEQERRLLRRRRARLGTGPPDGREIFGLAFSGGGIRSATLGLGVLQGLSDLRLLTRVDYLSTVSGGGYIGSWLDALIRNRFDGRPAGAQTLLSPEANRVPEAPTRDPVSFLRKYSNYLAPRPGELSPDSWVIALIWLRNVLLNQLILLPALGVVLLAPLLFLFVQQVPSQRLPFAGALPVAATLIVVAMLGGAAVIMWENLEAVVGQTFGDRADPERDSRWNGRTVLAVVLVFATAVVLGWPGLPPPEVAGRFAYLLQRARHPQIAVSLWHEATAAVAFFAAMPSAVGVFAGVVAMFGLLQVKGGFVRSFERRHPSRRDRETPPPPGTPDAGARRRARLYVALMVPAAALVTFALIVAVWGAIQRPHPHAFQPTFAAPLMTLCLLAGMTVLTGLMGADYPDAAREWLASVMARLALLSAGWVALFGIALYGPWLVAWTLGHYDKSAMAAIAGWIGTTAAGVMAGRRVEAGRTEGPPRRSALGWIVLIAPPAFMAGYLLLIAFGAQQAFASVEGVGPAPAAAASFPRDGGATFAGARAWADAYDRTLAYPDGFPYGLLALMALGAGVAAVAATRININEFSMHHFYKNRLVRCYLGASRGDRRRPNRLTGFDPADDFPLAALTPPAYLGPFPIVNTSLNLNVGIELSQQERQAVSFAFTPAYCGFAPSRSDEGEKPAGPDEYEARNGFRRTSGYSGVGGPSLGSATAISGAAANPNCGYSTSGPMAFLLTVFDARLGWWLGNPRWRRASTRPGPQFALWYLAAELFGRAHARKRFVNLSDGGHFDNLGLYELVRRRCRYIVVVDGEEDGGLTFGSLGGAIRKCRADFGVEIDIDPGPIRLDADGASGAHCVMGAITYPEPADDDRVTMVTDDVVAATDRRRGWLFYLKSSLTGDEPADVTEYRSRNPKFPHQSTGDQFFSESQFESYRRLGLHIGRSAFEEVLSWQAAPAADPVDLRTVFKLLTQKWYAPIPVTPEAASQLADEYSALLRTLRETPALAPLLPCLFEGAASAAVPPPTADDPALVLFAAEAIQLMQNVVTEFELEHAANRANPRNAGWMRVFRQWVNPDAFLYRQAWPRLKANYNPLFQRFVDDLSSEVRHQRKRTDVPNRP